MLQSHNAPLHIAGVKLIAHDGPTLAAYYRDVIGLDLIAERDRLISLGSGGEAYLDIEHRPEAKREDPRSAGLFHTAFLLPSRAALGSWFRQTHDRGAVFTGASDHGVSEAFYLDDPEGNGIEVYADRQREQWPRRGTGVNMTTERMDVAGVAAAGEAAQAHRGFPPEARIGHVHLRVGDVKAVRDFYTGALGLDPMDERPGGAFYSWGGYHHHIATNQWQSAGAGRRPADVTGLAEIGITVNDGALLSQITARAIGSSDRNKLRLEDPAGIALVLAAA